MIDTLFPDVSTSLSAIGLLLDIIGVGILFWFGLPAEVSRTGQGALLLEQTDEAEIEKAKRYDRCAGVGLGLLILGFALQLLGTYA